MTTKTNIEAVNSGQTEREAFEQFPRDKKFPVLPVWKDGRPFQNYALEVMFDAWQARAALASAEAQPIYQEQFGGAWVDVTKDRYERVGKEYEYARIVYAAQPTTRVESSDRYFLVPENGSYLIVDHVRSEMRGDEPDYYVLSWTPNKADAQFVCDVMNSSPTQSVETKPSSQASGETE